MGKYVNETSFTHVYDKYEYFVEDFECAVCANFKSRGVANRCGGHGCGRTVCEFQDLKDEAIKHNRVKRPKGWKQCVEA